MDHEHTNLTRSGTIASGYSFVCGQTRTRYYLVRRRACPHTKITVANHFMVCVAGSADDYSNLSVRACIIFTHLYNTGHLFTGGQLQSRVSSDATHLREQSLVEN